MESVNLIAVLVSAVVTMIIGSLWYSPKVFGTLWMKLEGVTHKDVEAAKKEMPKMYAGMFVASLVMVYVLGRFVNLQHMVMQDMSGLMVGAIVGFWAWLGFVATSFLSSILASGKPMKLYLIQAGYYLVTLVVVGAIIGAMH